MGLFVLWITSRNTRSGRKQGVRVGVGARGRGSRYAGDAGYSITGGVHETDSSATGKRCACQLGKSATPATRSPEEMRMRTRGRGGCVGSGISIRRLLDHREERDADYSIPGRDAHANPGAGSVRGVGDLDTPAMPATRSPGESAMPAPRSPGERCACQPGSGGCVGRGSRYAGDAGYSITGKSAMPATRSPERARCRVLGHREEMRMPTGGSAQPLGGGRCE